MPEDPAVDAGLAELSKFFVGDTNVFDTLRRVAVLAVEAVDVAAFASVTMVVDGAVTTGVYTDDEAPQIDQAMYDADDGPCLEAFRTGEILRIGSTTADGRWPEFRRACIAHGISSTASFPMLIDETTHGAVEHVLARC